MLKEAKFLHFSDWPMPKPWMGAHGDVQEKTQPACQTVDGKEDCRARDMWNGFYADFSARRKAGLRYYCARTHANGAAERLWIRNQ